GNAQAPAYLEAQIAYRERRFADAARIAHTAFADSPTLYEVGVIEARAHHEIALSYNEVNKLAEADAEFTTARQIFGRVLEVARSDDEAWLGYASLVSSQASLRGRPGGGLGLELRGEAIDALHTAREIHRDRWEPYFREAELYIGEGNIEILRYRDPAVYVDRALPLAEQSRAYGADGDAVDALVCQGYWERAVYQGHNGIDPHATYRQAIEACERAVATRSNTENHNSLGIVYGALADYDGDHGRDPMPMYALAERELRATISIDDNAGFHYNLGRHWTKVARYQALHGLDPRRTVDNALTELDNTARRDGRRSDAWSSIADALLARARFLRMRREDAQPTLAQARAALERSLAVDAEMTSAFKYRTLLAELDAEALLEQRADPAPAVASMRADADHVLARLPDDGFAHQMRSRAEVLAARWAIARSGAVEPLLARATREATRAREIDPLAARAWTTSAEVEAVRAEAARARGADASAALASGRAFIERAIAIDPSHLQTQAVARALDR
ncbi:MAG TPA: hypothetical protein VLM79_04590, partial [Kofleriaceae bacterium]|nr:hypothetical protein [Kofleriaceae bacterium]